MTLSQKSKLLVLSSAWLGFACSDEPAASGAKAGAGASSGETNASTAGTPSSGPSTGGGLPASGGAPADGAAGSPEVADAAGAGSPSAEGSGGEPSTGPAGAAGQIAVAGASAAGNAGAAGSAGDSSSAGTSNGTGTLGAACSSDSDCSGGLFCLTEHRVFGGQIAGGLCTVSCAQDASVCEELDPDAACFGDVDEPETGSDIEAFCLEGCADLEADKCHQRTNVGCWIISASGVFGACFPFCHDDSQCTDGRLCDPFSGACIDGPIEGEPDGEDCVDDSDCQGRCLEISEQAGTCTSDCVIHSDAIACHLESGSEDVVRSVCFPEPGETAMNNDIGFCRPTCDTSDDCSSDWVCIELDAEFLSLFGRRGVCGPAG